VRRLMAASISVLLSDMDFTFTHSSQHHGAAWQSAPTV
jgi:hypothetical protein